MFLLLIEIGLIVTVAVALIGGEEIWLVLPICSLIYVVSKFRKKSYVGETPY